MIPRAVCSLISLWRGTTTFWSPQRKIEWFPPSRSSAKSLSAAAAAVAIFLISSFRLTSLD